MPQRGSVFSTNDRVTFAVDELTDDGDDYVKAVLYTSDGDYVYEIGTWPIGNNHRDTNNGDYDDDDFYFDWTVDVGPGEYFVRAFEIDDGSADDDVNRSYTFIIEGSNGASKRSEAEIVSEKKIASESRKKRSIYAE